MKNKRNLETIFENLGTSRVEVYQKKSLKLRAYLSSNKTTRKEQVKEIEDYVWGRSEENPLQKIYDEYQKDLDEIEQRIEKYSKNS